VRTRRFHNGLDVQVLSNGLPGSKIRAGLFDTNNLHMYTFFVLWPPKCVCTTCLPPPLLILCSLSPMTLSWLFTVETSRRQPPLAADSPIPSPVYCTTTGAHAICQHRRRLPSLLAGSPQIPSVLLFLLRSGASLIKGICVD
jgi:hypothetical protein